MFVEVAAIIRQLFHHCVAEPDCEPVTHSSVVSRCEEGGVVFSACID